MDFMSSLTGKSPSTTGFGSEGALTKGPFNALWPVVDMNNAIVSAILSACNEAGVPVVEGPIPLARLYQADELMITSQTFDHAARLRSYEITARAFAAG